MAVIISLEWPLLAPCPQLEFWGKGEPHRDPAASHLQEIAWVSLGSRSPVGKYHEYS